MDTVTAQILLKPPFLSFPPFIQYRLSTLEEMHCCSQRASTYLTSIMGLLCFNALNFFLLWICQKGMFFFFPSLLGFQALSPTRNGPCQKEQCGQDTIIQMSLTDRVQYTLTLSESNSGQYLTPRSHLLSQRRSESGSEEYVWECECEECVSACRLWRALLVWCC